MVQWLRISLQCRGHLCEPWARKIPQATEQLIHVPQLLSLCSGAPEPQPPAPGRLEPELCYQRSHHSEKPSPATREQPLLPATRETRLAAMKTQSSQKISKYF